MIGPSKSVGVALTWAILLAVVSAKQQQRQEQRSDTPPPIYDVPSFTMEEIQSTKHDQELKDIITSTGLFAIRVPLYHDDIPENNMKINSNSSKTRTSNSPNLLEALCKCPPQNIAQIANGDSRVLSDGTTRRSTIATATRGSSSSSSSLPLSLPKSDIDQYCDGGGSGSGSTSVYESLEKVRDYVATASNDVFVPALDRLIQQAKTTTTTTSPLLTTQKKNNNNSNKEYDTISSILNDANHLEHFHLYSKNTKRNDNSSRYDYGSRASSRSTATAVDNALNWHTDGGLFLAFVPGTSCRDNGRSATTAADEDDSFHIVVPNNKNDNGIETEIESRARFPRTTKYEITVAIMLGAGAEHWLHIPKDSLGLRATKHAVKMKEGDVRAWYGMMHLVPSQAIIQQHPIPRTFAEMKKSSVHSVSRTFGGDDTATTTRNDIVIGCGNEEIETGNTYDSTTHMQQKFARASSSKRHRLQHVGGQSDCDGSGKYFCWLSCLATPKDSKSIEDHLKVDESLYCLDPSVLDRTGNLTLAVDECSEPYSGKPGGIMNEACNNYWYTTTGDVQSYLTPEDGSFDNQNKGEMKYCYGATSMYMQGFEWEGTTCVVFLFAPWVISSRTAMAGACIGTILLAILTELVTRHRRSVLNRITRPKVKVFTSASLYAIQVSLGYVVMLVVMTYSGPLVLSVILGLATGHLIINWNVKEREDIPIEGSTPCCQYDGDESSVVTREQSA